MREARGRLVAVCGVLVLALASCGNGDTASEPEAPAPAGDVVVEVADSDLGQILTDPEGRTLYVFLQDTDGESTCYDECEATWPPLTAGSGQPAGGDGVDASQLGTTQRTDGTSQVTYAGQPLYYFSTDEAPGDTNGQAIGDVWFVVSSDGEPVQEKKAGGGAGYK